VGGVCTDPVYYGTTQGRRDLMLLRAFVAREMQAVLHTSDVTVWEELVISSLKKYIVVLHIDICVCTNTILYLDFFLK
jgi:hypothetical protein